MLSLLDRLTGYRLRRRWRNQRGRVAEIRAALLHQEQDRPPDWVWHLMPAPGKKWPDLSALDTCPSKYRHTNQGPPRDLRGIVLRNLDLRGSSVLADTCLDYATFDGVLLDDASLRGASLRRTTFRENCVLDRANIQYANLRRAGLRGVSLEGADLTGSDIRGADFEDAHLGGVLFAEVIFGREPALGFLYPRPLRQRTRFGGDYQSPALLHPRCDPLIFRHIVGENFRRTFNGAHPQLGPLWSMLANYGRSPLRLLFWTAVIWLLFGYLYADLPRPHLACAPASWLEPVAAWLSPHIPWSGAPISPVDFTPLYASATTMTSLGFSDAFSGALPLKAQIYTSAQSVLGVLLTGAFITVLLQSISSSREPIWPVPPATPPAPPDAAIPPEPLRATPGLAADALPIKPSGAAASLSWESVWSELQTALRSLPACQGHPHYPEIRTLPGGAANDVIGVHDSGVTIQSHRTGKERRIPEPVLRTWWDRLVAEGTLSLKSPPTATNSGVIASILVTCLPGKVRLVDGSTLELVQNALGGAP